MWKTGRTNINYTEKLKVQAITLVNEWKMSYQEKTGCLKLGI